MADINISELPLISLATNDDVFIINDANATTSQINWSQLQNSIQNLTGQITFGQGSAEEPSITFLGDLNLGIFSPGLDTLGFSTSGSERMRIDPSGNVAIGLTAPSNFNSNAYNLVIGNTASSDNGLTVVSSTADTGNLYFADGTGSGSEDAGQITYDHSDDHLHFSTAASERLRINSVGKVGIGTSAIKSNLHVRGGDSGVTATPSGQSGIIIESGAAESGALQFFNAPGTNAYVNFGDSGSLDAGYLRYDHSDNTFTIQTLGSERFHLTATGDVGLGLAPNNTVLDVNNAASGATSYTGVSVSSEIQGDVTQDFRYFRSTAGTQDVTFNLTNLHHFSATQGTFGGTSSVDNQYGFSVDSGMSGGTNNYGFYSGLNQAANTYGFYAAGSADHYFNGDNFIIANGGTEAARVSGDILTVAKGVTFTGGTTAARPGSPSAGLMRFNSDIASWEGYNGFGWGSIGGSATTTSSPPSNANEGDMWFDIDNGRSYVYYNDGDSNQWVEMNPSLNGGVANGSVSTPQLVDNAVTEPKILDLNVTNSKLATNSVTATKIQDGSVTPAKLDRSYVESGGGTMTGALNVPASATGTQVPQVQEVVKKAGDTMTGDLTTTNLILPDSGHATFGTTKGGGTGTTLVTKNLDFFEQGTWTPEFQNSTGGPLFVNNSLTIYTADYMKLGNMVYVAFYIANDASFSYGPGVTTTSGVYVGNLPFPVVGNDIVTQPGAVHSFTCGWFSNWTAWGAGYTPAGYSSPDNNSIYVCYPVANGMTRVPASALYSANSSLAMSGWYRTDA